MREEVLTERFEHLLNRLAFTDEAIAWVSSALRESHAAEQEEHEAAIRRLRGEYDRLQGRIHAIYVDKLDGWIDQHFWERLPTDWRREQDKCFQEIAWHQAADQSYLEEGMRLLSLARNAARLFAAQEPREKRRMLNFVLSNSTWKDGELTATFHQPFDLIAEMTTLSGPSGGGGSSNPPSHLNWLGDLEGYQSQF